MPATAPTLNPLKKIKYVFEGLFLTEPRKQVPARSQGKGKPGSPGYRGFLLPFVTGSKCDMSVSC